MSQSPTADHAEQPTDHGGLPFEATLDNWLGLHIIPLYKRIMSDKVRGLGRSFGA